MLLRCPKCGAITSTEPPTTFPFCNKCREYLLKCRYCRFYDHSAYQCAHPEVRAFVAPGDEIPGSDPDAMTECEYFQPMPRMIYVPIPAWKRLLLFAAKVTPIAFLVVALGYSALFVAEVYRRPGGGAPRPTLQVSLGLPRQIYQVSPGRPFAVRIALRNTSNKPVGPVDVCVNEQFFGLCELRAISPPPSDISIVAGRRHFRYESIPAKGLMVVELVCRARKGGKTIFVLTVMAPATVEYRGPYGEPTSIPHRRVHIYAL